MKSSILLTIMLLTIFMCSNAQVYPNDVIAVTTYRIEAEVNEEAGGMCDLSDAVIADRVDMTFDSYGDTLVARTAGMTRDWFEIRGDTVWSIGSNTREESFRYLHGVPYLILSSNNGYASIDSVSQQIFYMREHSGTAASMYSSAPGCGYIFNPNDTVASTYCVTTITADSLYTVRNRRWYAEGCIWPVVEDFTLTSNDSTFASALYICPPSEQAHITQRAAAKNNNNSNNNPSSKNYSRTTKSSDYSNDLVYNRLAAADRAKAGNIDNIDIATTQTTDISPTPSGIRILTDAADYTCTIRLFDSAGRLWRESSGTFTSTDNIPPGTYLIEISTSTTTETHKIQIR